MSHIGNVLPTEQTPYCYLVSYTVEMRRDGADLRQRGGGVIAFSSPIVGGEDVDALHTYVREEVDRRLADGAVLIDSLVPLSYWTPEGIRPVGFPA